MDRLDTLLAEVADEVGFDLRGLLDDSACDRLVRATRLHDLTAVLLSRTIAEVDERKATDILYGARTSTWLSATAKVSVTTVRRRINIAAKLDGLLDEVDAAWAAGLLTEDHVKVFHDAANPRIKHEIAALQTKLIDLAQQYTFHHWRLLVATVVHELDQDGAFDPDAERERNTASFSTTLDGDCALNARFDRLMYARLKPLVDAKAQALFAHYSSTRDASGNKVKIPSRGCLCALALVELAEAGAAASGNGRPVPGATFVLTPDLLDSTTHIADTTADDTDTDDDLDPERTEPDQPTATDRHPDPDDDDNDGNGNGAATSGATASEPEHTADLDDDEGADTNPDPVPATPSPRPSGPTLQTGRISGWRAWTLDGLLLPGANPDLAAQLCDATTGTLLLDLDGTLLSMGRAVRLFERPQRTAMAIRDGGCVMPGCHLPPDACRAHHIDMWHRDHGNTDVIVGALLCDRDHGIPHRADWNMSITLDGWTWFIPPTGPSFWGQRHGIQRTGPTPDQPGYTGTPSINLAARNLHPPDPHATTTPDPSPTIASAPQDHTVEPATEPRTRPPRSPGDAPEPPSPNDPPTEPVPPNRSHRTRRPRSAATANGHGSAGPSATPEQMAECVRTLEQVVGRHIDELRAEPPDRRADFWPPLLGAD